MREIQYTSNRPRHHHNCMKISYGFLSSCFVQEFLERALSRTDQPHRNAFRTQYSQRKVANALTALAGLKSGNHGAGIEPGLLQMQVAVVVVFCLVGFVLVVTAPIFMNACVPLSTWLKTTLHIIDCFCFRWCKINRIRKTHMHSGSRHKKRNICNPTCRCCLSLQQICLHSQPAQTDTPALLKLTH